MKTPLEQLLSLLQQRGHERYTGEPVTHLQHALQAATLAERAGASDALVTAALLHDIGHLWHGLPGTPSAAGVDDHHEAVAADVLSRCFGDDVVQPVALHVAAKRRLCMNGAYLRVLTDDSLRSLALQGGPMSPAEGQAFDARPFAQDALRLRHWDEAAKRPGMVTEPLAHFWPRVQASLCLPGMPDRSDLRGTR